MSGKNNNDKIKGVLPTLRQKKRYVVFKIEGKRKFTFQEISQSVLKHLITFLGSIDFGKGGVWLLRDQFNHEKQIAIVRTSTKLKEKTVGSLSLLKKINNENVKTTVLGASGTLKGAKEYFKK